MLTYTIERRLTDSGPPDATVERKRRDAARLALCRAVREHVASHAGLDTKWGWNLYREAQSAPLDKPGAYDFRTAGRDGFVRLVIAEPAGQVVKDLLGN